MNKIKTEMDDANEQYKKDKVRVSILAVDFIQIAWTNLTNRGMDENNWEEKLRISLSDAPTNTGSVSQSSERVRHSDFRL